MMSQQVPLEAKGGRAVPLIQLLAELGVVAMVPRRPEVRRRAGPEVRYPAPEAIQL